MEVANYEQTDRAQGQTLGPVNRPIGITVGTNSKHIANTMVTTKKAYKNATNTGKFPKNSEEPKKE